MPYDEAFYIPKKSKSTHQSFVRKGEKRNRPRDPQPGQGSIRVENGGEATWLKSDPRSAPKTPKVSRFASVIGEETARRAPPSPVAGAQSPDPLFGAPLFRREPLDSSPVAGPHGPFPAGPRREATPYSGGRRVATPYSGGGSPGLEAPRENEAERRYAEERRLHSPNPPSFPTMSPAEDWRFSRPQGGDSLSDYYAQQEDVGRRQAAAEAEAQRLARERMEAAIIREGMLEDYRRERDRRFGAK